MTAPATVEQRRALAETESRAARRAFTATCEKREEDGRTLRSLSGYASVVGVEYDMGWYVEEIARGAFDKTLAEKPDVVLLVNHEGLPLARTKAGDLTLSADNTGLLVDAPRLDPEDPDVSRLAAKMDRGLLDEMSFAFRIERQEWNQDYTKRYISEVSLHRGDVSVVNYGANPSTSTTLRAAELLARLEDLGPDEQRAAYERLAVLLEPTAVRSGGGVSFAIGERVQVTGEPHEPGQSTGTVAEVGGTAYGVVFDAMPDMGIHRWYVAAELAELEETGEVEPEPADDMTSMQRSAARRRALELLG